MLRFVRRPAAVALGLVAALGAGCDDAPPPVPDPGPPVPETTEPPAPEPPPSACVPGPVLDFGFYAFFESVSHVADPNPDAAGFFEHRGYEADLLTALESMDGAGLRFRRTPVAEWPDIWLLPSTPDFDVAGGGITILRERRRNRSGVEVVAFTGGHIVFRQSLLVRSADARRLGTYEDLTDDVRVGVLVGTTGESRLLVLAGLADEQGILEPGIQIELADGGAVMTDGTALYVIAPSGASRSLERRVRLVPPSRNEPQVVFFAGDTTESEQARALRAREVDALARGEIGNRTLAQAAGGAFVLTALDDAVEYGGFTVDVDEPELLACLDETLDWLTDDRAIGYADWLANPNVFAERAAAWRR